MIELSGHRVRRQTLRGRAADPGSAFVLRATLRRNADRLSAALGDAFDQACPADVPIHLPRLELTLRLQAGDDLEAILPERVRELALRELAILLPQSLPSAIPGAAPARPGTQDREPLADATGDDAVPAPASDPQSAALELYLVTGTTPWHLAGVDAPALAERFGALARAMLSTLAARAPDPVPAARLYFFRLLDLLPAAHWPELARKVGGARDAYDVPRAFDALASSAVALPAYARLEIAALLLVAARRPLGDPAVAAEGRRLTAALPATIAARVASWLAEKGVALPGFAPGERNTDAFSPIPIVVPALAARADLSDPASVVASKTPSLANAAAARVESPASRHPDDGPNDGASTPLRPGPERGVERAGDRGPLEFPAEPLPANAEGAESNVATGRRAPEHPAATGVLGRQAPPNRADLQPATASSSTTVPAASLLPAAETERSQIAEGRGHGEPAAPHLAAAEASLQAWPWSDPAIDARPWPVAHAGLVVLHPYLPLFFERLGCREGRGLAAARLPRAAAALHYLATGSDEVHEFDLGLVKTLLGLPLDGPLPIAAGLLDDADRSEADDLLRAVVAHWNALKSTSPAGLRQTFLRRRGFLRAESRGDLLQVESAAYDVLLGRLPWAIGVVRLPWMLRTLYTEWPTP